MFHLSGCFTFGTKPRTAWADIACALCPPVCSLSHSHARAPLNLKQAMRWRRELAPGLDGVFDLLDVLVREWSLKNNQRVKVALIKRGIQISQELLQDLENERVQNP